MKKLLCIILSFCVLLSVSFSVIAVNEGKDDTEENIGDLFGLYSVTYIEGEKEWFEYYEDNAEIEYDSLTAKRGSDYYWSLSAEEYIAPPKNINGENVTVYAYNNPVLSFENYAFDPGNNYAIKSMAVQPSGEMAYSGHKSLKYVNAQYSIVTSKPSTWDTNYNNYYTLVDGKFVKNSFESAPAFDSQEFYEIRNGQREHSAVLGKIEASVTYKLSFRYYIKENLNSSVYLTPFTGHSNLWAGGAAETGLRVDYSDAKYTISTDKAAGEWYKGNIYFTASQSAINDYNNLYVFFSAATANNYDVIYFDDFSVEETVVTKSVVYHYNNGVDEDKVITEGVTLGMTIDIDHIPENIPEGKYFMGWYSDEELTNPVAQINVPSTSDNGDFSAHVYAKYGDYKEEHSTVYNSTNPAPVGYGYMLGGTYSNTLTEGGWATVNFKEDGVHFTKNRYNGQAGIFNPAKTDGLTQYSGTGYITPNNVKEAPCEVGEIANVGWGINSSYALKDAQGNMLIAKPNTTYTAVVTYKVTKEGSGYFQITAGRPNDYINKGANDFHSNLYSNAYSNSISIAGKSATGEYETAFLTLKTEELTDCLPVISFYGCVAGYRARRLAEVDGVASYTYTNSGVTYTAYPYEIIDVPEYIIKEIKLVEVKDGESAVAYNYYTQGVGFSAELNKGAIGSILNAPATNNVDTHWYTDKEAFDRYESSLYPTSNISLYNAEYLLNKSHEILSGYNVGLYAGAKGLVSATVEKDGKQVPALKYNLYGYDEYYTLSGKDYNDKDDVASTESKKVENMNAALSKGANMFRLGKVVDGHTYKVSFSYKAEEMNTDLTLSLATAQKNNAYLFRSYITDYTISKTSDTGWNEVTFFVTADLGGSVSDIQGGNDTILSINYDELFISIAQTVTKSDLSGENNTIYFADIALTDLGEVVTAGGASVLTENAALATKNQALRYYFNYGTADGNTIVLDGKTYTITERGFIYKNGAVEKYAPNSLYSGGMTKGANGVVIERKTKDFNNCWEYNQNSHVLTFSTYVNGFTEEKYDYDLIVRGYITFVDEKGVEHTIYSDTVNRSVTYVLAGGESANDPNARYLVWSAGIEGASSIADLNDLQQDTTASSTEGKYYIDSTNNTAVKTTGSDYEYEIVKGGKNWIIENGAMILRIDYADGYSAADGDDIRYTMAKCVNTKNQMSFKYGYMEIDAELPFAYGSWLGYWTRPQYEFDAAYKERVGNNHEFDIFEVFGLTRQTEKVWDWGSLSFVTKYVGDPIAGVKPQLHKWFSLDGGGSTSVQIGGSTTQFTNKTNTFMIGEQSTAYSFGTDLTTARKRHRYGFEWTEEYVAMYVDPVVVNGVPISDPYWKINIELENDYWLDAYEKSKGMQCFHEEAYLCLSNAIITSANTFIYEGNYADKKDVIAENGGKPIDYKIYSCKLYQRAGETIDYH